MPELACYHGTPNPDSLVEHGPDMEYPRSRDVGDLGWGFYCTTNYVRAARYGTVIAVTLEVGSFAHVSNPYFLDGLEEVEPQTEEERLFHQLVFGNFGMRTVVAGAGREAAARQVRAEFLARGFQGIWSDYLAELVVFDIQAVRHVELYKTPKGVKSKC